MAHYAEIKNNRVIRVLVMNDDWSEDQCLQWLAKHVSDNQWLQTSYNGNIRSKYAGVGDEYHADIDAFVGRKPYNSWLLDKDKKCYVAPQPMPKDGGDYIWNERLQAWEDMSI